MSTSSNEPGPTTKRQLASALVDIAAWGSIGVFFAVLIWEVCGRQIYIPSLGSYFGKLPLQLLIAGLAALPSGLGTIWLVRRNRRTIAKWFGPLAVAVETPSTSDRHKAIGKSDRQTKPQEKRRWFLIGTDVAAWACIAIFLTILVWIVSQPAKYDHRPGAVPTEVWVYMIDTPFVVFAVVWLAFRNSRRMAEFFRRL
jgi:hypothetical protein